MAKMRSGITFTLAKLSDGSFVAAQCVPTERPLRSPAAPSKKAPVQTEPRRRIAPALRGARSIAQDEPAAAAMQWFPRASAQQRGGAWHNLLRRPASIRADHRPDGPPCNSL
jgi:hypothetical protein